MLYKTDNHYSRDHKFKVARRLRTEPVRPIEQSLAAHSLFTPLTEAEIERVLICLEEEK